ncbi:hypothetical protein Tsubulata_035973 [Turnera subulata]|uniref:Anaphase-promoting complex subunit 4 WD40 domain-containing protein n=1 Tax=Turnera subulata TaxID=218843 RepID=A0A9Q0EXP4_9ROSI|nr:hypothetical protein Tsubulata_035973 [Turnera subulata]
MAQSPDGCTVATAAGDETLRFWNVFGVPQVGAKAAPKSTHHEPFSHVAPAPDGGDEVMEGKNGDIISRTFLLGKVYSLKIFTTNTFKGGLSRVWNLDGGFQVTGRGYNCMEPLLDFLD